MELVFLGTGGGRWTTLTQKLSTGGFRLSWKKEFHIDPGPGALVALRDNGLRATDTDAILVSHCHPDHYNDAEVLIEAMTKGMTKAKGALAASKSVLEGHNELGPGVSSYHRSMVKEVVLMRAGEEFRLYGMSIEALPTKHSDPTAVGLKFHTETGAITYTSDTQYFDGLPEHYEDSRVLILNSIRPRNARIPWHLCTEDVIEIVSRAKPKLAVMQHFGLRMIPDSKGEAQLVEERSGVRTIAATDGLRLDLEEVA